MNEPDGVLVLLQDIKEMFYGLPLLLSGWLYVRHGWTAHEVTDKQD